MPYPISRRLSVWHLALSPILVLSIASCYSRAQFIDSSPVGDDRTPVAHVNADKPQRGPVFSCDNAVFDWGEVLQGSSISHAFRVVNTGDLPLAVRDISQTCHCVNAFRDFNRPILSGEAVSIPVVIKSSVISGRARQSITVKTNEPAGQNEHELIVTGIVLPIFDPAPPRQLSIVGSLDTPETSEAVPLSAAAGIDLFIEDVFTESNELLGAQIDNTNEPPLLVVRAKQPQGRSAYSETVVLKGLANGEAITVRIECIVEFRNPVFLENPQVIFNTIRKARDLTDGQKQMKTFRVRSNRKREFKVLAVQADERYLALAGVQKDTDGYSYTVTVQMIGLPEHAVSSPYRIPVTITTDVSGFNILKGEALIVIPKS